MSTATATRPMTTEELLAMSDDGVERYLIEGELREWFHDRGPDAMSIRNRWHAQAEARISQILNNWNDAQPEPRGTIMAGDAGFILAENPDTTVGIDVAYVSEEVVASQDEGATLIAGAPTLAVEILSPSDTNERTKEKLRAYRAAGVKLIWLVDPELRTIMVIRDTDEPELFNVKHTIENEPLLPGLSLEVRWVFM